MEIVVLVILVPLIFTVIGLALLANAIETIQKAKRDWHKYK
jgi:hypothetical protein